MLTAEKILSCEKTELANVAKSLEPEDIKQLVEWLNEKDDNIRYFSFLLLQHRASIWKDVYPYWEVFVSKFYSTNSYQRSLGLMLTAENARWDDEGRFDGIIDLFLAFCEDEKPITVRQCIQSLCKVVPYKRHLSERIARKLMSINIMDRKETQRKILLMDILSILAVIRTGERIEGVEEYICNAMTGGLLDKKAKAWIEMVLKNGRDL